MNMQSHPVRVLLIDDDEDDYIIVRDLLSDHLFTEYSFSSGFQITRLHWMQSFPVSSMSACWTTGSRSEMGWNSCKRL